jgi:hypothetical protein
MHYPEKLSSPQSEVGDSTLLTIPGYALGDRLNGTTRVEPLRTRLALPSAIFLERGLGKAIAVWMSVKSVYFSANTQFTRVLTPKPVAPALW